MENNNKKKSVVVALAILLVASVSFTMAYFTAQLSGDNATNVQVSSKAQTSLIFNKGDDLSLNLGVENLYDGAGNVTSTTNPSVSLSAPEVVTEKYSVYFDITTNEFVYSVDSDTPELILTVLDENGDPVTSIKDLVYVTVGDVSGFDITEASGLFEVITDAEITADNNTVISDWTFTLSFINLETDQVLNAGKNFDAEISFSQGEYTESISYFGDMILLNNGGVEAIELKQADFNKAALSAEQYDTYGEWCTSDDYCSIDRVTKDETGMYSIEDNGGTSYYFRGAVDNNWVVFGEEDGSPIYWRIVRIEGNGNIKLIYSGTTAPEEGDAVTMLGAGTQLSSGTQVFNATYNSMEYAGYVYEIGEQHGTTTDSDIKDVVDTWYTNTLETSYGEFIEPQTSCIDRVTYTRSGDAGSYIYTKNNLTTTETYYGTAARLFRVADAAINFDCEVSEDVLSLNVGLISADEVALAGGHSYAYNSSYYLYTNSHYWTLSPSYFNGSSALAFFVNSSGLLINASVYTTLGVRPSVSLTSNISVSEGDGTYANPYVID